MPESASVLNLLLLAKALHMLTKEHIDDASDSLVEGLLSTS